MVFLSVSLKKKTWNIPFVNIIRNDSDIDIDIQHNIKINKISEEYAKYTKKMETEREKEVIKTWSYC